MADILNRGCNCELDLLASLIITRKVLGNQAQPGPRQVLIEHSDALSLSEDSDLHPTGSRALATPIIESLETRVASLSSSHPSVPLGLSGSTR